MRVKLELSAVKADRAFRGSSSLDVKQRINIQNIAIKYRNCGERNYILKVWMEGGTKGRVQ